MESINRRACKLFLRPPNTTHVGNESRRKTKLRGSDYFPEQLVSLSPHFPPLPQIESTAFNQQCPTPPPNQIKVEALQGEVAGLRGYLKNAGGEATTSKGNPSTTAAQANLNCQELQVGEMLRIVCSGGGGVTIGYGNQGTSVAEQNRSFGLIVGGVVLCVEDGDRVTRLSLFLFWVAAL